MSSVHTIILSCKVNPLHRFLVTYLRSGKHNLFNVKPYYVYLKHASGHQYQLHPDLTRCEHEQLQKSLYYIWESNSSQTNLSWSDLIKVRASSLQYQLPLDRDNISHNKMSEFKLVVKKFHWTSLRGVAILEIWTFLFGVTVPYQI
jgi:hypothetical protein